jgi:ABC-type transport system substrate-binding protein
MMWRHLSPGGPTAFGFRHPRFSELGEAARFSIDEKFRGRAYAEMSQIVLEQLPWIIVLHPIESYGVQKAVDWTPYSNQQIELRAFNLKLQKG